MKYIFFVLLLYANVTLNAQEFMTLEKAISLGLENNFDIKIAETAIQIAENNNSWARAGKVPIVDLQGTFNNNLIQDNNPASFLQGAFYTGGLGASANVRWEVYSGGRIKIAKDQLEVAVSQQQLNKETGIHSLLRDIYQRYYEVIFQQEQLEVFKEVFEVSNIRLDYEKVRREFGSTNTYNLIQFENAVILDSTNIISQEQRVETAKRNLYQVLDMASSENYEFRERLSIAVEEIDENRLRKVLNEENYTIKSLEMIARLNALNTKLAEAAQKPTLQLSSSVGYTQNAFKFFGENPNTGETIPFVTSNRLNATFGAVLNYNLYDGGVRTTDVQNAILQQEIDQINILEAKVELNNQLDILIDNYRNQLELLEMTEEQISLAQRNLNITEERFRAGQVTSIDFRNIQNQFLNAAFAKVNSIYNLLITKSEIDFLVGSFQ